MVTFHFYIIAEQYQRASIKSFRLASLQKLYITDEQYLNTIRNGLTTKIK